MFPAYIVKPWDDREVPHCSLNFPSPKTSSGHTSHLCEASWPEHNVIFLGSYFYIKSAWREKTLKKYLSCVVNHGGIFYFFFIYWLVLFFVKKSFFGSSKAKNKKKKKKKQKQNTLETRHLSNKNPDNCGLIQMHWHRAQAATLKFHICSQDQRSTLINKCEYDFLWLILYAFNILFGLTYKRVSFSFFFLG